MHKIFLPALALSLSLCLQPISTMAQPAPIGTQHSANPLLRPFATPQGIAPFASITPRDYREAILQGMDEHKQEVRAIVVNRARPDFDNTIAALDAAGALLQRASSTFYPLTSSNSTPELRQAQQELAPLTTAHYDDIYLNAQLFAKVRAVHADKQVRSRLNHEQLSLLDKVYKHFVRAGALLTSEQKKRLRSLNTEMAQLELEFSQNLMFETNNSLVLVDDVAKLEGLTDDQKARAAQLATAQGHEGRWAINMQRSSCEPVLRYAKDRDLRKQVYLTYVNRGNQGNQYDSKAIAAKLVRLRLEKAKLMGYKYASLALETRMAKTPKAVYGLLDAVWGPALKKVQEELADIRREIAREGGNFEPEGWDYMYYLNKAKQAKYAIDDKEVAQYFEVNRVLQGVFHVAQQLYGLTFQERTPDYPSYEPTAQSWDVLDREGHLIAVFYSDYQPREGKRAGAWCTSFRPQTYAEGKRIAPVVVNVCSFTAPTTEKPALLSLDEVETLFHEFGHALHSFFRDVHYNGVGSVERDFVELPSQILEHWALQPEVLKVYAKHYQTGEDIPLTLVEKLNEASKYGQGFATTEYLAAALVDMDLHTLTNVPQNFDVMRFEEQQLAHRGLPRQIQPRYRVTNFAHSIGGGYTAGYYSYLWSEVLDADGFQAFKETGNIYHPVVAERFRRNVLTPGGIDDGMTMYRNFRGREPKIDALLENRGLK